MLDQFAGHIDSEFPELRTQALLIACSGGLDSVVLARLCSALGLRFALAHCNFQLRGSESDGDARFVAELAAKLDVPYFTKVFDLKGQLSSSEASPQLRARELRYAWFNDLVEETAFDLVLTAHHADDRLETFLINLSRGTGIEGLSGIPASNGTIKRPLLPFSRKELLEFALAQGYIWREDRSNQDTKYLRNQVRHEVVPALKGLHSEFLAHFLKSLHFLEATEKLVKMHIDGVRDRLFQNRGDGSYQIDLASVMALDPLPTHLFWLFKDFGFTAPEEVAKLFKADSGKEIRSKTHRLLKDRGRLLLKPANATQDAEFWISETQGYIDHPLAMDITMVKTVSDPAANVAFIDKEKLNYPLLLRKWQKGDYFYPLGMRGRKKLSKFFKDEKYDGFAKEAQWLLCSGDAIVWVIGKRLDERFKVGPSTDNILKFTVQ
ncbi:tRNA lysidine(34) synthetase TilS [Flagellimonas sp. DF-77]|uniref:tRNA lysidine(34) synthetase TilS n=1 Tax=Flagellimonas algarum TaxID=3230298 RepID=UPI003393CA51